MFLSCPTSVSVISEREMVLNFDSLAVELHFRRPCSHRNEVADGLRCLRAKPRTTSERYRRPEPDFLAALGVRDQTGKLYFRVVCVHKGEAFCFCRTEQASPLCNAGLPFRSRMLPDTNPVTVLFAGAPRILPELAPEQQHADEEAISSHLPGSAPLSP